MRRVLNVFAIILAVLLSILLCLSLSVWAFCRGGEALLQPEGLAEVLERTDCGELLENIDYEAVLENLGDITVPGTDYVMNRETILKAVDTLDKEALAELYVEDVIAALRRQSGGRFTADAVEEVLLRSQDELLEVAYELVDEEAVRQQIVATVSEQFSFLGSEEQRQQVIDAYLEEHEQEVQWAVDAARATITAAMPGVIRMISETALEEVPAPRELTDQLLGEIEKAELREAVHLAVFGALLAAGVLALLVFLLRFRRWKGLCWLGVDTLLAALLTYLVSAALPRREAVAYLSSQLPTDIRLDSVIAAGAAFLSGQFRHSALLLAAVGAGLLVLFALLFALSGRQRGEEALVP